MRESLKVSPVPNRKFMDFRTSFTLKPSPRQSGRDEKFEFEAGVDGSAAKPIGCDCGKTEWLRLWVGILTLSLRTSILF
jgi:hypothetical protein